MAAAGTQLVNLFIKWRTRGFVGSIAVVGDYRRSHAGQHTACGQRPLAIVIIILILLLLMMIIIALPVLFLLSRLLLMRLRSHYPGANHSASHRAT